jgi:NAD(P)H dehydrogenase (quinone)
MPLIVTGATGALGRLTVEDLLRRGVPAGEIVAAGRDVGRLSGACGYAWLTTPIPPRCALPSPA